MARTPNIHGGGARTNANGLRFEQTTSLDGDNLRVTNIVGIQNGDFLKECPKCGRAKCSEQFGLRTTVNRDQSECTDCRGEY